MFVLIKLDIKYLILVLNATLIMAIKVQIDLLGEQVHPNVIANVYRALTMCSFYCSGNGSSKSLSNLPKVNS